MNIRAEIFGGVKRTLLKEKQPKQADAKGLTDVQIARQEARRTNSRDRDRYRLTDQAVRVTYRNDDYEGEAVNVSGGGAMIALELQPNIGECMQLYLGEGDGIECAVRWIKGGRLGLEFAHETQLHCSENERAVVLREVIQRTFADEKFEARPEVAEVEEEEDGRAATRHPLIWSGDLHYGSNSWRVRLRNISTTGALVECPGPVRDGAEIMLDLDKSGTVFATVSWIVGDHIGLRFDEPFDLRQLSQSRPQVTPSKWVRPSYLKNDVDADSAWDDSWRRMSVDQLRSELEGFLKR
jgi:hypothetical protein